MYAEVHISITDLSNERRKATVMKINYEVHDIVPRSILYHLRDASTNYWWSVLGLQILCTFFSAS
jgi:hypothetical protein